MRRAKIATAWVVTTGSVRAPAVVSLLVLLVVGPAAVANLPAPAAEARASLDRCDLLPSPSGRCLGTDPERWLPSVGFDSFPSPLGPFPHPGSGPLRSLMGVSSPPLEALSGLVRGAASLAPSSPAAWGGSETWRADFVGPHNSWEFASDATVGPDGARVYVTGTSTGDGTWFDFATAAYDASTGAPLWLSRFDGPAGEGDAATALGLSPDGSRLYVTGFGVAPGAGFDVLTVAYDTATGEQEWMARFNGLGNGPDGAFALGVSPDDSLVFVAGTTFTVRATAFADGFDFVTIAYDAATGEERWAARFNGPRAGHDVARALGVSPDGSRVFVTGEVEAPDLGWDYGTVAYDAGTGRELWTAAHGPGEFAEGLTLSPDGNRVYVTGIGGNSYDTVAYNADTGEEAWEGHYRNGRNDVAYATAIAASPLGVVYVTGGSFGAGTNQDVATVAYDGATGEQGWVARYNDPGNLYNLGRSIAVARDGARVYVASAAYYWADVALSDIVTLAYTADGTQAWESTFDGPGQGTSQDWDDPAKITLSPDGSRAFVTGEGWGGGSLVDYATVAYGASGGAQEWSATYDGLGRAGLDVAYALEVAPDGSHVFVSGASRKGSGYDYLTIAYGSDGAKVWEARYDGTANDYDVPFAMGVSPDGSRLFVTGTSWGPGSGLDYATVAYDAATGQQAWVARYDGPRSDHDLAVALRVSPDGSRVHVTGSSVGGLGGVVQIPVYDYATVAYDAATGAELWVARFNGPPTFHDFANALDVSPDGARVYVTGQSDAGGSARYDYLTAAYDAATGQEAWTARHDGFGFDSDEAFDVAAAPDGLTVFVTGMSATPTSIDYVTIAYDAATGLPRWLAAFNPVTADGAFQVEVAPDGSRVYVSGIVFGPRDNDFGTVAYDALTGLPLWVALYDEPPLSTEFLPDMEVTQDGSRLYLTGLSFTRATGWDYATLGYDAATGREVFRARFNGEANDEDAPYALGLSPDGSRVYVTGGSWGRATSLDYVTLAYDVAGDEGPLPALP